MIKIFHKAPASVLMVVFALALVGVGPAAALAATDPGLGAVASFSILSQTTITGISTISGDVGNNATGAGITALTTPNVAGTIYSTDGVAPGVAILNPAVQANASTAYTTTIPGQGSDGTIVGNLDGQTFTPGVYDQGTMLLAGGVVHLNGPGIYIFRSASDLTSSGSISLENGARACDVYWRVQTLATINGASFVGTILSGTGIHFGPGVALNGRALGVGPTADVTLGVGGTISGPTCPPPAPRLTVTKVVVNDNGGTKVISDFPLFIDGSGVTSGVASTTLAGLHTVSETSDAGYASTIGGDCAADGTITLLPGDVKTCTITNNDIAPPPPPPPSGGNGPPVGSLPAPVNTPAPGVVLGTSTVIVAQTPTPIPTPTVPLANLPNTGYGLADEVSKIISLAVPSAIFALMVTLYLFRKRG